ncbi:hypothetical protein SBADM41S_06272 [Streptomyces badius]
MARAEFCSDTGALDEGITVLRRAVAASHPSGYGGSACRTALGDALRNLARHASDPAPLEESVRWHREAVAVARGAPPPMALLGLANSLGALYRHSRDVRQSEEAVRLYQAVLDSPRPTPHGLRGSVLTGLGFIRWTRAVESGTRRSETWPSAPCARPRPRRPAYAGGWRSRIWAGPSWTAACSPATGSGWPRP